MPKKSEPLLICPFSYKGGVAKTTSIYEIAFNLRKAGYRVLLIDADPQANLTARVYGDALVASSVEEVDSLANNMAQWNTARDHTGKRTTIFHIFDNMIAQHERRLPDYNAIGEQVEPILLPNQIDKDWDEGIKLIPGDDRIRSVIRKIPDLGATNPEFKNTNEAITQVFRQIARKQGFDVVLIDLSPEDSNWNISITMGADFMYVPVFADVFSSRALPATLRLLLEKKVDINNLYGQRYPEGNEFIIREDRGPFGRVKLGGVFLQAARGSKNSKQTVKRRNNPDLNRAASEANSLIQEEEYGLFKAYQSWRNELFKTLQEYLPQLKSRGLLSNTEAFYISSRTHLDPNQTELSVGEQRLPEGVKYFSSFGLNAQAAGVPLSGLKHWFENGPVLSRNKSLRDELSKAKTRLGKVGNWYKKHLINALKKNIGALFPHPPADEEARYGMEVNGQVSDLPYIGWYTPEMVDGAINTYITQGASALAFLAEEELNLQGTIIWTSLRLKVGKIYARTISASSEDLNYFHQRLREWFEFHLERYSNCSLVLPCVLNSRFSVVMLKPDQMVENKWEIELFDPIGLSPAQVHGHSIYQAVKSFFEESQPPLEFEIKFNEHRYTQDAYNSGPWVVEAVRESLSSTHRLPVDNEIIGRNFSIDQRREDHRADNLELFNQHLSDQNDSFVQQGPVTRAGAHEQEEDMQSAAVAASEEDNTSPRENGQPPRTPTPHALNESGLSESDDKDSDYEEGAASSQPPTRSSARLKHLRVDASTAQPSSSRYLERDENSESEDADAAASSIHYITRRRVPAGLANKRARTSTEGAFVWRNRSDTSSLASSESDSETETTPCE